MLGAQRNRRLRRVDWRFLLPTLPPRRAVCFAKGRLAEGVAEIAELVPPEEESVSTCDLAVVVDPDRATLDAAFRSLLPGGACYGEWYSVRRGDPLRVRKTLEAAGFADIEGYWFWPIPTRSSPQFWLPLRAKHALAHFLATRPPAHTFAGRLKQLSLQTAWRLALRLRLLRPVCFVARKPHDGTSAEGILAAIAQHSNSIELGRPARRLTWILLAGGAAVTNKLVGLVFADDEEQPRFVAKFPRVPESQPLIEREATSLRAVHASRAAGVPGVPRLLFFDRDWCVVGETMVGGRPLTTLLNRERYSELALNVTEWLCELAGAPVPVPRERWWNRLVENPLEDFVRSFDDAAVSPEIAATRARLDTLGNLPLVPEQRDCAPWNILVATDEGIVVHDWESAEPRGLPLLDLVYFLTYSAFFLDGAMESKRFAESYRSSVDPMTFTGRVTAACERAYIERLNLEPAVVVPLRALCWVIHSRPELTRIARDTATGVLPVGRSLFRTLLREELRRQN
jgi:hypothetical protein